MDDVRFPIFFSDRSTVLAVSSTTSKVRRVVEKVFAVTCRCYESLRSFKRLIAAASLSSAPLKVVAIYFSRFQEAFSPWSRTGPGGYKG